MGKPTGFGLVDLTYGIDMRLILEFSWFNGEEGGRVTTPVDHDSKESLLSDLYEFVKAQAAAYPFSWESTDKFLGDPEVIYDRLCDLVPDLTDDPAPMVYTVDEWFEKRGAKKA